MWSSRSRLCRQADRREEKGATVTQLFVIERDFTGYSEAEVNAAAFRAKVCAMYFERMRWVRSFYDEVTQQSRCLYEALSANDVQLHARASVVSCEQVSPVEELFPSDVVDLDDARFAPLRDESEGSSLWLSRVSLPASAPVELVAEAVLAVPLLVRAYLDREAEELMLVFKAHSRPELSLPVGLQAIDLRVVSEVLPTDIEPADELVMA